MCWYANHWAWRHCAFTAAYVTLMPVLWVQVSFLHFFLFTWSMSTLAMTLASFITRATIVNLTVFISFVLIMFMTLFLAMGRAYESFFAYDAALWVKFLVYPMPWTHFGKVCTPVVSARGAVAQPGAWLGALLMVHRYLWTSLT